MAIRCAMHQAGGAALSQLLQFDPPRPEERQRPCSCGHTAQLRAAQQTRADCPIYSFLEILPFLSVSMRSSNCLTSSSPSAHLSCGFDTAAFDRSL